MNRTPLSNRFLAAFLAVITVFSLLPWITLRASAADTIPTGISRIVFADSTATGNGSGSSPENAVSSLHAAFTELDKGTGDGVIILSGPVTFNESYNVGSTALENHSGTYYVTSKYGTYDFTKSAALNITGSGNRNLNHNGPTHYSNVTIHLDLEGKNLIIYSSTDLTIGEKVSITRSTASAASEISLYCGNYHGGTNSANLTVSSGGWSTILAGNGRNDMTGTVNLTFGGTATVKNLYCGGNNKAAGDVNITINGGTITNFYATGNTASSKSVTIDWNSGNCTNGLFVKSASSAGSVTGNFSVELNKAVVFGSNAKLQLEGTPAASVGGTSTIRLQGFTGNMPLELGEFDNIILTGNSNLVYSGTYSGSNAQSITVNEGSSLQLTSYDSAAAVPATLTVSGTGTVNWGGSAPTASVVYVDGTKTSNGTGTKESPYNNLNSAYAAVPAGGTIVFMNTVTYAPTTTTTYSYGSSITGTVTLTSKYGDDDYSANTAIAISGNKKAYFFFGNNVVIDTLKITGESDSIYMYSGLTMDATNLITSTTGSTEGGITIYTATPAECGDVSVILRDSNVRQVLMGGVDNNVGNVTLELRGNTRVESTVTMGSAKTSGNATLEVEDNTYIARINSAARAGGVIDGNVYIRLYGGSVGHLLDHTYDSTINGDVSITVDARYFSFAETWDDAPYDSNTTFSSTSEKKLTIKGFSGTIYQKVLQFFDIVNFSENSNVTYKGQFLETNTIKVGAGSTLTLTAYENMAAVEATGATLKGNAYGAANPDEAWGTVIFGGITFLDVVFVDGTVAASGNGTQTAPVKTLAEAYDLLDPKNGGTIVIMGDTWFPQFDKYTTKQDSDGNGTYESSHGRLYSIGVNATVTITSVYGGVDYRALNGAQILFDDPTLNETTNDTEGDGTDEGTTTTVIGNEKIYVTLGASTILDNVTLTSTASAYICTGEKMIIRDTVLSSGNFTLYLGYDNANCTTANLEIHGGTWRQLIIGGYKCDITNANVWFGDKAKIGSNITLGSSRIVDNLELTIDGGTINAIFCSPRSGGHVERATVNFISGGLNRMVDYGHSKSKATMGTVIINLYPEFNTGIQFGQWADGELLEVDATILNYFNYNGIGFLGMEYYDVVNLYGGSTIPSGYTIAPETAEKLLRIHGYQGDLGLDITMFSKIRVTGNSNVYCAGKVNAGTKLDVSDSGLWIRPMMNPGITLANYTILSNDTIHFEDSAANNHDPLLDVNFNDGTAGSGTAVGDLQYVAGYDGGKAVHFVNTFGKEAQQYIKFENLGIDITKDDYTVMFWYMTENGGFANWSSSAYSVVGGSPINMSGLRYRGGVIMSNQDTFNDNSGMSLVQLPHYQFVVSGVTGADGTHVDADGMRELTDDRWHHFAISYDRDGSYKIYIDGKLSVVRSIADFANDTLGTNTLVLGADALGQYGLENAYIDDFTLYAGTLDLVDVQAQFHQQNLNNLLNRIETQVADLGRQYDSYKAEILAKAEAVRANAAGQDYVVLYDLYNELRADYEAFLLKPEANLSLLLLSDIHLGAAGADTYGRLEMVLKDISEQGLNLDGFTSAGDFADTADPAVTQAAFDTLNSLLAKYSLEDLMMVGCFGNHEMSYASEAHNYLTTSPVYWENIMAQTQKHIDSGKATLDYINYEPGFYDAATGEYGGKYSYAVTMNGYHFLVLNTDYVPQTGDSSKYTDANGSYSVEGNAVDPIRHTARFEEESYEWIEMVLDEYAKDGLPIFSMCHYGFIGSAPLVLPNDRVINDNSIGVVTNDRLLQLFGNYENMIYFSGHVHSSLGMIDPGYVTEDTQGNPLNHTVTCMSLPALRSSTRSYQNIPATYIMYIYDDEIVLRARDFSTGEWLTQFDTTIKLKAEAAHTHDLTHFAANPASYTAPGNIEYWYCEDCDKYFSDADATNEIAQADTVIPQHIAWGDANGDKQITDEDAALVKQYRAGLVGESALDLSLCDVDGNGKVDAYDAYLIQLFVALRLDQFPCEN